MKANVITNVLLVVLIGLVIVCTAVIQQELHETRLVIKQLPSVTTNASTTTATSDHQTTATATTDTTDTRTKPAITTGSQTDATSTGHATTTHTQTAGTDLTDKTDSSNHTAATATATQPKDKTDDAAIAPPPPVPSVDDELWTAHGQQVTGIIRDLLAGTYDPVVSQFNAQMKAALPKAQLAVVMDTAREAHGGLDHIAKHEMMDAPLPQGMHAFVLTAATERGDPLVFTITLDAQGKIAGLYLR